MNRSATRQRRELRDRPYLPEHQRRNAQLARGPRHNDEFLRWFIDGFVAETPEAIHASGVWAGATARPGSREIPAELTGGSVLGAPKYAEPFRQLLENDAQQWAEDPATGERHYVRPMRAALAELARSRGSDDAMMAAFLVQVGYARGGWSDVTERFGIPDWCAEAVLGAALRRLYRVWSDQPLRLR